MMRQIYRDIKENGPEIAKLEAVRGIYRGEFLESFEVKNCFELNDWIFYERENLQRKYFEVLNILANEYRLQQKYYKCIETYVARLLDHCADRSDTNLNASAFQSVFEYLEKNFTIYKLLLSNEGIGFFRSRLYDIIAQTVTDVIGIKPENNAFSNGVTTHFLTSGFIGVLEWWINNSMPCSVQEITEQLMFLLEPYTKHLESR
jgi:hypothetical protein